MTGIPCPDCMLDIVKVGIHRKVVYHNNYKPDKLSMLARQEEWETTKKIAKLGGCVLDVYSGNLNWMRDWMNTMYNKGVFD